MPDEFKSPEQDRAEYAQKKRSMTAADKTDRERARGAEVAAANARKFEEAEAARAAEEGAKVEPDAPAETDFEKAAGGFPVAQPPVQPTPAPEPAPGTPPEPAPDPKP